MSERWIMGALFALTWGPLAHAQDTAISWSVADRYRLYVTDTHHYGSVDRINVLDGYVSPQDQLLDTISHNTSSCPAHAKIDDAAVQCLYTVLRDFYLVKHAFSAGEEVLPFKATRWMGASISPQFIDPKANVQSMDANKRTRRYQDDYVYPDMVFIRAHISSPAAGALCEWTFSGPRKDITSGKVSCSSEIAVPVAFASNLDADGSKQPVASGKLAVAVYAPDGSGVAASHAIDVVVKDTLIVSMGDSYASGEANPDVPVDWSWMDAGPKFLTAAPESSKPAASDKIAYRWWHDRPSLAEMPTANLAQWWDSTCHRSLRNQHVVASLLRAAADPHGTVTFASFACSGAAVLDGMVVVQDPPGANEFGAPKSDENPSQLENVRRLLCGTGDPEPASGDTVKAAAIQASLQMGANSRTISSTPRLPEAQWRCADGRRKPRRVDILLVVIGGNDVRFGGAIADGILPQFTDDLTGIVSLSQVRKLANATPPQEANRQIRFDLPRLLAINDRGFEAILGPTSHVIQTEYPDPMGDEHGDFCSGYSSNQLFGSFSGIWPDFAARTRRWRVQIDPQEDQYVREGLVNPLNAALEANAKRVSNSPSVAGDPLGRRWKIAPAGALFLHHGWCAYGPEEAFNGARTSNAAITKPEFLFPYYFLPLSPGEKGGWLPIPPGSWKAYPETMRVRWINSPNDVVLTQIASTNRLLPMILGDWSVPIGPFNALRGMFHPTMAAHVAMGLSVAAQMPPISSDNQQMP